MILTGNKIKEEIQNGNIVIDPFNEEQVNPNSYDLRVGPVAMFLPSYTNYQPTVFDLVPNDKEDETPIFHKRTLLYPQEHNGMQAFFLKPDVIYLMNTFEIAGSTCYVPIIEGKSSIARLGIQIHMTAGFGDTGFVNRWTLEVKVTHPTILPVGVRFCQISFTQVLGEITPYSGKYKDFAEYPMPSKIQDSIYKDLDNIKNIQNKLFN
jgi:dCTP deaminase